MTDNIQHIDPDGDEFIDAPKALREHVKALQASYKSLAQENTTLRGQATSAALGDVLAGYKNPERVKRDLLSDKIDPLDKTAVETWLSENGDDYARGDNGTATVQDEDAAAHQRLQQTELTSPADMTKLAAFEAEITPQMTGADVRALAAKHGI